MKLAIVGTHGIPAQYGGFETFVSHLVPACVEAGIAVTVINEKDNPVSPIPAGVTIFSSDYNKSESTLNFYRDSLLRAAPDHDIILSCGVGGAIYYPKIRNHSVKIVTNLDGLEHKRKKYSLLQRAMVYVLQRLAARRSDWLVSDSLAINKYWSGRFNRIRKKISTISYGADECLPFSESSLTKYGLEKDGYFLVVARLVPENNIREIVSAYEDYIGKRKLVIVGGIDDSGYVKKLQKNASPNIIFTDSIYDKSTLDSLRQGCYIYIHGHSVGGTNPALLEAMAASCVCICNNNVFNREVTLNTQLYFHSSVDLGIMLNLLDQQSTGLALMKEKALAIVNENYSWKKICNSYIDLFNQLNSKR